MLTKRIIAALDIANGRVVKGINFKNIKDSGDPLELSRRYEKEGIDELVFLDITATNEKRKIMTELVSRIASQIYIPFTVGGGLNSVDDMLSLIRNGADKIFVNTYAVENPDVISKIADRIGSANTVIAIDAQKINDEYYVFTHGGKKRTGINAIEWAEEVEKLGAGEILLTSINTDGTRNGFDTVLTYNVSNNVNIPVIASGGAGKPEDFLDIFKNGADAALAASIFHEEIYSVNEIKKYLMENGINVRL